ncbi:MAG: Gldg family protein [Lachnospiraceae bacterium]|nr:Gldg family protein [Lachnospiraceae bacterium]
MKAIFKRDFFSLFHNVMGWLFCGVLLGIYGLYFMVYNLMSGYPTLSYTISGITFLLMIACPLLCMRSLSEERKQKTDQLLLTSPVSVTSIVLGKYLALLACFSVVIGVICISPLVMSLYGEVNFAQNYTAIFGFFLFGMTCIAIGLFVSVFFENQIISAVVGFLILFLGYMMSSITGTVASSENLLVKILNCYDLISPVTSFLSGNLDLRNIFYYLSLTVLALFLTAQMLLKRRWSVSAAKPAFSVFSLSAVGIGIALCILLNVGLSYLPQEHITFDVTSQKLYTITDETKAYLKTLDEDITIYVIGEEENTDDVEKKMLELYDENSDHITVEYVDTQKNPTFTQAYTSSDLSTGSIIVAEKYRSKVIGYDELYTTEFDYETYTSSISSYDGEGKVTSALQYVTNENLPVICELRGHDETALTESFTDMVEKSNMRLSEINFLTSDSVPEQAKALMIHAPQTDFSEDDTKKLDAYLKSGGSVFITLDFHSIAGLDHVKNWLFSNGITVKDGLLADLDGDYYYQTPYFLLPNVELNDEFSNVSGTQSILAPYSIALEFDENDENETFTPILTTSEDAVIKTTITAENVSENVEKEVKKGMMDESGTFHPAVKIHTPFGGNIYVFGSSYIFTETVNSYVSGRNALLFSDVINGMVPQEDLKETVVIPPKKYELEYLLPTKNAITVFGLLFGIILPIIFVLVGIVIYLVRRRK